MRSITKLLSDLVSCRVRRSSKWIILGAILFISGNYWLLKSTFQKSTLHVDTKDDRELFIVNEHQQNIVITEDAAFLERNIDKNEKPKSTETLAPVHSVEKETPTSELDSSKFKIALLVISCNRVEVKRCLDKIFHHKPKDYPVQVIVSQDCGHQETANVIRSYGTQIKFIQQPDLGPVQGVPANMYRYMGYYKISRHFKFALGKVFETTDSDSVIIVEDDIDIGEMFLFLLLFISHSKVSQ